VSVATFVTAQLLRLLPRKRISQAVGLLCDQPLPPAVSNWVAKAYIKAYGVDMSEVEAIGYGSFDAFFTRSLRAGARRLDDAAIISPADGRVVDAGSVDSASRLSVKGRDYCVGELIGDPMEARRYSGGEFAVVYLSPRDYHRVHSPVAGNLGLVRRIPGDLFPVNSIGERHVPRLFVRNERVAMFIDTESLGRVAVVMVGAMIVGRISVTGLPDPLYPGDRAVVPPRHVAQGDELGVFHLGSTVVLLFDTIAGLSRHARQVRYGESLLGRS
jgi:phosphatidylserine decarboxylase